MTPNPRIRACQALPQGKPPAQRCARCRFLPLCTGLLQRRFALMFPTTATVRPTRGWAGRSVRSSLKFADLSLLCIHSTGVLTARLLSFVLGEGRGERRAHRAMAQRRWSIARCDRRGEPEGNGLQAANGVLTFAALGGSSPQGF